MLTAAHLAQPLFFAAADSFSHSTTPATVSTAPDKPEDQSNGPPARDSKHPGQHPPEEPKSRLKALDAWMAEPVHRIADCSRAEENGELWPIEETAPRGATFRLVFRRAFGGDSHGRLSRGRGMGAKLSPSTLAAFARAGRK
jgi:hypothetical protein